MELFGERDKVVVLYSLATLAEPVSGVQVYKVENGRIVEIWAHTRAVGVLWEWNPDVYGDTDTQANTRIMHRWYDEVYQEANWNLVPEVAGPNYIRHESTEFEMSGEEYSQRIRPLFVYLGKMDIDYEVIAGADKIAVIAQWLDSTYVQAWRVKNGKLVESWFPGMDGGFGLRSLGLFFVAVILYILINLVVWISYFRRRRSKRALSLIWHCILPWAIDSALLWLALILIPQTFKVGFTLIPSMPYLAFIATLSGMIVGLNVLIRFRSYRAINRRAAQTLQ